MQRHWVVLVLDMRTRRLLYHDSLGDYAAADCFAAGRRLLLCEASRVGREVDPHSWAEVIVNVPQQGPTIDCGMHVCANVLAVVSGQVRVLRLPSTLLRALGVFSSWVRCGGCLSRKRVTARTTWYSSGNLCCCLS